MAAPKMYFIKSPLDEGSTMEEACLACESHQIETLVCDISEFRNLYKKQLTSTRKNIVVTDRFSGDDFTELKEIENIKLVGPLCVLACLNDGISIPNSMVPLSNISMKDTVVCCSGISKDDKARIKNLVISMYGKVTDDYVAKTTHLVTDSVITVKYAMAAENGKYIMTPAWVEAIWKESQLRVVRYDDNQFDKYKCPVFYNLRICSTGIANKLMLNIAKMIRNHGGLFSSEMSVSRTDVLLCDIGNFRNSSKYKAVLSRRGPAANIRCLTVQWVHDSIRQGHALPEDSYAILNVSTPNAKISKENDMHPDMFLLSRVTNGDLSVANCTTVDATMVHPDQMKRDISAIDMSVLKQASTFLDGCNIYLICIVGDDLAFVQRALKFAGAIRLDSYSDRVTHVVVGNDKNDVHRQELRTLIERLRNQQAVHIVSMRWLVDSIQAQSPLVEDTYSVSMESPQASQDIDGSPLSKKGLILLRTDTSIRTERSTLTSVKNISNDSTFKAPDELHQYMQTDNETLARYWNDVNTEDLEGVDTLKNATDTSIAVVANPEEMETDGSNFLKIRKREPKSVSSKETHGADTINESKIITTPLKPDASTMIEDKTIERTFNKKTFLLLQFDTAEMDELTKHINALDGCVMSRASGSRSYRGVADYAIVPLFSNREATRTVTAQHVLTDIWVRECADKGRPVAPAYYHQCVTEEATDALIGCVVCTTAITHWEQTYLIAVIQHMGGHTQGDLSKIVHEQRGLVATTHLLTNSTKQNKKYDAAKRWGILTVNSRWAEECLRAGKRLPEANYPILQVGLDSPRFISPMFVKTRDSSSKKQAMAAPDTPPDRACVSNPATPRCDTVKKRMNFVPDTPQFQSPALSQSPSSQVSPITREYNEIMASVKSQVERGVLYDSDCDSPTKRRLSEQKALLKTPDTPVSPFSANLLGPNPTRVERRELREFLSKIPDNTPPPPVRHRRLSTPMSELKRRIITKCDENYEKLRQQFRQEAEETSQVLDKERQRATESGDDDVFMHGANNTINNDVDTTDDVGDSNSTTVPAHIIEEKMRNLSDMLGTPIANSKPPKPTTVTPVAGFSELPDSQTYSVGWEYDVEIITAKLETKERVFLITGCEIEVKDALQSKIERLGAKVAPEQTKFDKITHLLCSKVSRNEKTLCSIASGKWVLHVDFIEESLKAGKFLDEELFEFSNPKSTIPVADKDVERARCAVHWRQVVQRTGKGAFHDMRAIILGKVGVASVTNIVEAGGGAIVQSRPPYENNDYATHCLIDSKSVNNTSDLVPMAKCGIYCVPHIYVFNFLVNRKLNMLQEVIPQLAQYYSK